MYKCKDCGYILSNKKDQCPICKSENICIMGTSDIFRSNDECDEENDDYSDEIFE